MSRRNRHIRAGRPYELCLRVKQGMPFVCKYLIKLIFESAMARAQRDCKVTNCHYILMTNHIHQVVVTKDADSCKKYYMELKKKLTDAFKRLLGLDEMIMWESRHMVAEILDIDEAVERISYIYANPARANLVDKVEEYPGLSTWNDFISSEALQSSFSRDVPWVRLPSIPRLASLELKETQDLFYTRKLRELCKNESHTLEIKPNAWMHCFGINDDQRVVSLNKRILSRTRDREDNARVARLRVNKKVIGAAKLRKQGIVMSYKPSRKERKIFVLSSDKDLRIEYIHYYNDIIRKAKAAYHSFITGYSCTWPPGTFRPPLPPCASTLGTFC